MEPRWKVNKRERDRMRYWEDPEKYKARQREYYAEHREECIARVRRWQKNKIIEEWNKHFTKVYD